MALMGRSMIMGGRQTTSGTTPITILGSKLEAWWDGADPFADGSPPVDGTVNILFSDKSGNAHDLEIRNGSPTYRSGANGLNGRGVVEFDGTDDGMSTSSPFVYALGTPEVWFIAKSDESGEGTIWSEGLTSNANAVYRVLDIDATNDYLFQLTNTANTDRILNSQDRSTNAWDLVITTDKGAATGTSNEVVDVDAGTTGAYTRDGPSFDILSVGFTRRTTNTQWFDGRIAEILVLSSAASSGERSALAAYFNDKWGQSWSPA